MIELIDGHKVIKIGMHWTEEATGSGSRKANLQFDLPALMISPTKYIIVLTFYWHVHDNE